MLQLLLQKPRREREKNSWLEFNSTPLPPPSPSRSHLPASPCRGKSRHDTCSWSRRPVWQRDDSRCVIISLINLPCPSQYCSYFQLCFTETATGNCSGVNAERVTPGRAARTSCWRQNSRSSSSCYEINYLFRQSYFSIQPNCSKFSSTPSKAAETLIDLLL